VVQGRDGQDARLGKVGRYDKMTSWTEVLPAWAASRSTMLSMALQFHLSVLTRLSIGTQFWVFIYALVVCFVLVCT